MQDVYVSLSKILRVPQEMLLNMNARMTALTGQEGVLEDVMMQNRILVDRTLSEFGLTRDANADRVYLTLMNHLIHLDQHLYEALGKPDLSKMSKTCGKLCEFAFRVFTPPRGMFIKRERATHLLEKYPPTEMMQHFGYSSVHELIDKEGFSSVVSALRFTQSKEWMHTFFDKAYSELTPDDFEEREVEMKILEDKWTAAAGKFVAKKHHNISHLKEYGIIFVTPVKLDIPGETIRMFTLIMHYLHEVPFYSGLIRKYMDAPDFAEKLKSLLRGDVPTERIQYLEPNRITWRVVQQYLTKDNPDDFRLFEPHVNPEADHWFRAEEDLGRLSRMMDEEHGGAHFGFWTGLDFVGDVFRDPKGQEQLVSFDLVDLIMSLVDREKNEVKYLYHQQEALWNKIFSEFMGRERMDRLIEENLISGYIKLP